MKTKINGILTLLLAFVVQMTFAQEGMISGVVSDDMGPVADISVKVKGTTTGTVTDFGGHYAVKAKSGDTLVFSHVSYGTVERVVTTSNKLDVVLGMNGNTLVEVVITTAKNIKAKPKDIAYANQILKAEDLSIGKDNNLKTALNGKIAGVQVAAQSGAKLGSAGKVYLRGAISATGRSEAIYIIDGVISDSENVDMDNVESINVLKGPSAVSLYGLKGADGVILITTKGGKKGKAKVTIFNNTTFENAAYFLDYQNEYGQGGSWGDAEFSTFDYNSQTYYPNEWAVLDGGRYMGTEYVDESWGPKFDGEPYIPWYAWWPGSTENPNPYYGKTIPYAAQPDNIKDYYNTGVTMKSGFSISGGSDTANGRLSYSKTDQKGILPDSEAGNHNLAAKFTVAINEKLSVAVNATFNNRNWTGQFADTYGTGTSANFNQWFGRNLDVNKMRELKDLKTLNGHTASWNWWGPDLYAQGSNFDENTANGDFTKPTFWFNPYYQSSLDKQERKRNRLVTSVNAVYKVSDHLKFGVDVSRDGSSYTFSYKVPYELQYNAAFFRFNDSYINSISTREANSSDIIISPYVNYNTTIKEDFNLDIYVGAEHEIYDLLDVRNSMTTSGNNPYTANYGLVIPDVFNVANSRERVDPNYSRSRQYKQNSIFSRVKLGYKDYLTLTGDVTNTWDSRYDIANRDNKNSFMFGSLGLAFVFSNLIEEKGFLDFGKVRLSTGYVGSVVEPYKLNPANNLGDSYNSNPSMYLSSTASNPNVKPATSKSYEGGVDLRMFKNRLSLSATYFDEHRTDQILNSGTSATSGVTSIIVNAGDVKRAGFEIQLSGKPVKTKNFNWNIDFNWSNPKTTVLSLADGQQRQLVGEFSLDHRSSFGVTELTNLPGQEWGQLVGNAIKRNDSGVPIVDANGLYDFESGHNYGSVLPDFIGGFVNSFRYKSISLSGTIAFQKGGKFFSLSEWWGTQTGLLSNTVGDNDLGNPVRDAVADGGGVHVVGVDNAGVAVDTYVEAQPYYSQYYAQRIAEPFIHDASYIKLADLSISYTIPKKVLGKALDAASFGIFARNLGMLSVSKDNKHNWDPSELTYQWGEDGGLPGTRSIGFNLKITL